MHTVKDSDINLMQSGTMLKELNKLVTDNYFSIY